MSLPATARMPLGGWGRYPVEDCIAYRPERTDQLAQIVARAPEPTLIGRGAGRSYGDASLNEHQGVVLHERLHRFLAFDEGEGILRCEAGVSLAEIIDCFLPRGFFFPVTPGTKHISVGGAIAADVHGKNHHRDGSISSQLLDFRLLAASGEILQCSRSENSEAFWATLGGMGLTGLILDARLRLRRVQTAYLDVYTERAPDLDRVLRSIEENDRDYAYSVAWIDCLAQGRGLGRSVMLRANPAPLEALPEKVRRAALSIRRESRLRVPFNLPSVLLNDLTMASFNALFYHARRDGHAITSYESYFYPLDAVLHWNRVYGKRGVLQYQVVIPTSSARVALSLLLEKITRSGGGSFLAVLKGMGAASEGLLSFPMPGLTLSLDFAYTGPDLIRMLNALDEIVLRHGGRVYLAKDACLRSEHFREMYPGLRRFREIKAKLDPEGRFSSSLARRLGLQESP